MMETIKYLHNVQSTEIQYADVTLLKGKMYECVQMKVHSNISSNK